MFSYFRPFTPGEEGFKCWNAAIGIDEGKNVIPANQLLMEESIYCDIILYSTEILSINCVEDLQAKFAVMTFDPVKLPTQSGCPDYNSELVIFIVS